MADKLQFDLVSPERLLFSGQVDMVAIPGAEGDMGIMAGHAPVMATLRPGIVNIDEAGKAQQRIFVRGGFAEVTPAGLTVLAEFTVPLAELDAAALDRQDRRQAPGRAGKARSPEAAPPGPLRIGGALAPGFPPLSGCGHRPRAAALKLPHRIHYNTVTKARLSARTEDA